nr:hypothetical protein [Tanacetum cinerariifolium]
MLIRNLSHWNSTGYHWIGKSSPDAANRKFVRSLWKETPPHLSDDARRFPS